MFFGERITPIVYQSGHIVLALIGFGLAGLYIKWEGAMVVGLAMNVGLPVWRAAGWFSGYFGSRVDRSDRGGKRRVKFG
jgi:hypothetical protein